MTLVRGIYNGVQGEIVDSEAVQEPEDPFWGSDLWPFNEERCECPEKTTIFPQEPGEPLGVGISFHNVNVWKCSSCDRIYTRRTL